MKCNIFHSKRKGKKKGRNKGTPEEQQESSEQQQHTATTTTRTTPPPRASSASTGNSRRKSPFSPLIERRNMRRHKRKQKKQQKQGAVLKSDQNSHEGEDRQPVTSPQRGHRSHSNSISNSNSIPHRPDGTPATTLNVTSSVKGARTMERHASTGTASTSRKGSQLSTNSDMNNCHGRGQNHRHAHAHAHIASSGPAASSSSNTKIKTSSTKHYSNRAKAQKGGGAPKDGHSPPDDHVLARMYDSIPPLEVTKLPRGGISIETEAVGRVQVRSSFSLSVFQFSPSFASYVQFRILHVYIRDRFSLIDLVKLFYFTPSQTHRPKPKLTFHF